jgi:tetratricopeptide (TPR) repeat protein
MPIRWPLAARDALEQIAELLDTTPAAGLALIGPDGVGKTTLAITAAERLGRGDPVVVIGTDARSSVPFGAFGALVEVTEVGKPAAMITSAMDSLLAHANTAPIVVDDAHLLDPLSAALIYQLARSGSVTLIVTVRSVLAAPEAVTALWRDGLLGRFDVIGLDGAETAAVVSAAALVSAAGGADAAALYRRSAGNPLQLRMLLTTGGTEETLPGAVDDYLAGLAEPVRAVLGYLRAFEPLPRTDLVALAGAAAVDAAVDAGAVRLHGDDVYCGHPVYLERLGAGSDRTSDRRHRAAVAAQLATRDCPTPGERLVRTLLTLDSDTPDDAEALVAGAQEALRLGDLSLAERLAGAALADDDRFDARLALSYALAWQGRGREAEAVLAAADAVGLTEEQTMALALPRAANQFWMLSEPERATAYLQTVRGRVGTAANQSTLDALSATFAMNAGNVRRATELADDVLARPDLPDMAVAWAASAAALSAARMGRFGDVASLAARAQASEHPGLLRFTVGMAEITALLMAERADDAWQAARRFTDFAELAQPGRAIGEVLLAQVLLARGDAAAAADLLRPASAILERTGYSWGPLALTYLATALAFQGEVAESAKALSRAQSRHGTKSALFAPELGIARAWRLNTIGDRPSAITAARDAARAAGRTGQFAIAVRCWHEAARLGDRRAADGLAEIADRADCAFTRSALEHARALVGGSD